MSLRQHVGAPEEETAGFFVEPDHASEGDEHHQLILQKANALASQNLLREAIDCVSLAMRCGPVQAQELSTVVDCIFRNFKSTLAGAESGSGQPWGRCGDNIFDCPSCRRYMGEPVTLACGHSYCRRCLHRRLLSTCRLCNEAVTGEQKLNITLSRLLEKWFPGERKTTRSLSELEELLSRNRHREAAALATDVLQAGECLLWPVVDGYGWRGASCVHIIVIATI